MTDATNHPKGQTPNSPLVSRLLIAAYSLAAAVWLADMFIWRAH